MAFFDDDSSSDSVENQSLSSHPNNGDKTPDILPERKSNFLPKHRSPKRATKWRGRIESNFVSSILSFRKSNIVYKKIITDNLNPAMIRQLNADNIEIIAAFLSLAKGSRGYREINNRFSDGCECYALIENSMLGLTWIYRNNYRLGGEGKLLKLTPDEALITDTISSESLDDSKAILLEDGVAMILKQRGVKPLVFACRGDENNPVYSIRQIRFIGLTFTMISSNSDHSPLGFR